MCAHTSPLNVRRRFKKKKKKKRHYWSGSEGGIGATCLYHCRTDCLTRRFQTRHSAVDFVRGKRLGLTLLLFFSSPYLFLFVKIKKIFVFSVKLTDGICLFRFKCGLHFQRDVSSCDSSHSKASQFLLEDLFYFIFWTQLAINPEQISVSDLLHMYYVIWIASGTWLQTYDRSSRSKMLLLPSSGQSNHHLCWCTDPLLSNYMVIEKLL